jgi:uncharacterized protein
MDTSQRIYSVRRPVAAFCAGAGVAILGGMIGLGGAEFRLPLLIAIFAIFPQRAVRINLLISLATLAASAAARLSLVHTTIVSSFTVEILGMVAGGVATAWVGAGILSRIPKRGITPIIAGLLVAIAILILVETAFAGATGLVLPQDQILRALAALLAGMVVGAVSSLLGVAGGELIIPVLIFLFGADIRTAGTASVLISIPVVVTGVVRHILTGHFRSPSMLGYLVLPMSAGSVLGAIVGGYLAVWSPGTLLRVVFAAILLASAAKLLTHRSQH